MDAQIQGPSGKALFQYYANDTTHLDFYICALSFGKNAVGDRQRIGATLSVYQNGQFIWWEDLQGTLPCPLIMACTYKKTLLVGMHACNHADASVTAILIGPGEFDGAMLSRYALTVTAELQSSPVACPQQRVKPRDAMT